jgi:hypothetical protein
MAAQINAQSPSEDSSTKVSAFPEISLRIDSPPEQADEDGPCEPRQEATEQVRWNAVFLSNCSPKP